MVMNLSKKTNFQCKEKIKLIQKYLIYNQPPTLKLGQPPAPLGAKPCTAELCKVLVSPSYAGAQVFLSLWQVFLTPSYAVGLVSPFWPSPNFVWAETSPPAQLRASPASLGAYQPSSFKNLQGARKSFASSPQKSLVPSSSRIYGVFALWLKTLQILELEGTRDFSSLLVNLSLGIGARLSVQVFFGFPKSLVPSSFQNLWSFYPLVFKLPQLC